MQSETKSERQEIPVNEQAFSVDRSLKALFQSGKIPGGRQLFKAYRNYVLKPLIYLGGGTHHKQSYYNDVLTTALANKRPLSDISDHLSAIFYFAADAAPKLIVELGTRGGDSTRALLAAAAVSKATMLSVDINDCGQIDIPYRDQWNFVHASDVEFGQSGFTQWCQERSIKPAIDVLFIDTSHLYDHTKEEIAVWNGYLSDTGTMIFHDTNMGSGTYARNDGSIGFGWDNQRGVIRALEEFLGRQYDEKTFFCDVTDKFTVIHFPNCNGLTVVKKRKT